MNCNDYRRQFSSHLDDRLPAGRRERLERHLLVCPSCCQAWEELRHLQTLLVGFPAPPCPEYLRGRIMAAARERLENSASRANARNAWLKAFCTWPMRAAAGAALGLGVVTGSLLGWQTGQPSPPPSLLVSAPVNIEVLYGLDVLGSQPDGSLEAVMVAMLADSSAGRR